MEKLQLSNGFELPILGFGVYQIGDLDECRRGVASALDWDYRLIDTAAFYGNERAVGDALRESAIPREEVSLSSKVWIQQNGYEGTMQSFEKTLINLQTDYLDLYLIHMPYGDYQGSWRAMEDLYDQGRVRAIGVCNFLPDRLIDLILSSRIAPMVNQIELHPFTQQIALRKVMDEQGIAPMAWAPLAKGRRGIFDNPVLMRIGQRYGKSPAQIILRWLTQQGICAIPKSAHEERIRENHNIADFSLDDDDMHDIRAMDTGGRLFLNVDTPEEAIRLHGLSYTQ
ncbi:aldo/keto reductase [Bifidobacterium sp. wkB344]|uniref:aldo/keto reductase n=1 Tax=Bifidobacterium sp. wkB344 TaxID=2025113 RepID=UPI000EF9A0BC|nr:aldo/keto reductase [Bifidobacterium sp. wkB344]RMA46229.1 2,5-diketo-D-gluconic acid reductase [Bifidobacterium sp. wkB344]